MLTDIPNLLTLSRIVAIPVLIALVAWRSPVGDLLATVLFAAAGVTDWLDGHLARARRQQSEIGRMLDPIADKLLVGATLILLAGRGGSPTRHCIPPSSSCCGKSWSAACVNTWLACASGCR